MSGNCVQIVRRTSYKFFHGRKFISSKFPCKVTRGLPYKLAKMIHDSLHVSFKFYTQKQEPWKKTRRRQWWLVVGTTYGRKRKKHLRDKARHDRCTTNLARQGKARCKENDEQQQQQPGRRRRKETTRLRIQNGNLWLLLLLLRMETIHIPALQKTETQKNLRR